MAYNKDTDKKSVAQIIIERFLKDVDEKGTMPWQRPYERYNAFNYFTLKAYRGINRLMLPGGEYLTRNQINQYNKDHNEDFRFQKGIEWFPVVFFKPDVRPVSEEVVRDLFPEANIDDNFYKYHEGWVYTRSNGKLVKRRSILRYYLVAERQHFKNSKGEMLPSRIETGKVVITKQKPQKLWDDYIQRSGVKVKTTMGTPCYSPFEDTIELNEYTASEDSWFSTAFHEAGHSTGHRSRLNREGVTKIIPNTEVYAKEECIAEITAYLCCAEAGISEVETSGTQEYNNNIAYVQAWKKRIQDWGNSFIYIVSQADKAFNFICGNPDESMPSSDEEE
jgi:antirestriction protein ArdC